MSQCSEHFCKLDLDEKGFKILVKYLNTCKQNTDFFITDNETQAKEIEIHVFRNWMDKNAGVHWVEEYGAAFRKYLNTIKLLWAAHVLEYGNDTNFTHEEYTRLVNNWQKVKEVLEGVF